MSWGRGASGRIAMRDYDEQTSNPTSKIYDAIDYWPQGPGFQVSLRIPCYGVAAPPQNASAEPHAT
jgi:hypothetical protein